MKQDIIDFNMIDELIVKNSDNILLIKKVKDEAIEKIKNVKDENAESIKLLDIRIRKIENKANWRRNEKNCYAKK